MPKKTKKEPEDTLGDIQETLDDLEKIATHPITKLLLALGAGVILFMAVVTVWAVMTWF